MFVLAHFDMQGLNTALSMLWITNIYLKLSSPWNKHWYINVYPLPLTIKYVDWVSTFCENYRLRKLVKLYLMLAKSFHYSHWVDSELSSYCSFLVKNRLEVLITLTNKHEKKFVICRKYKKHLKISRKEMILSFSFTISHKWRMSSCWSWSTIFHSKPLRTCLSRSSPKFKPSLCMCVYVCAHYCIPRWGSNV